MTTALKLPNKVNRDVVKTDGDIATHSFARGRCPLRRMPLDDDDAVIGEGVSIDPEQIQPTPPIWSVDQMAQRQDCIEAPPEAQFPNVAQRWLATNNVGEHHLRVVAATTS